MLTSTDDKESCWAVDMTLKIRGGNDVGDKSIRPRILPLLNIKAEKLIDLISWNGATESLYTCDLTKQDLENLRQRQLLSLIHI